MSTEIPVFKLAKLLNVMNDLILFKNYNDFQSYIEMLEGLAESYKDSQLISLIRAERLDISILLLSQEKLFKNIPDLDKDDVINKEMQAIYNELKNIANNKASSENVIKIYKAMISLKEFFNHYNHDPKEFRDDVQQIF